MRKYDQVCHFASIAPPNPLFSTLIPVSERPPLRPSVRRAAPNEGVPPALHAVARRTAASHGRGAVGFGALGLVAARVQRRGARDAE